MSDKAKKFFIKKQKRLRKKPRLMTLWQEKIAPVAYTSFMALGDVTSDIYTSTSSLDTVKTKKGPVTKTNTANGKVIVSYLVEQAVKNLKHDWRVEKKEAKFFTKGTWAVRDTEKPPIKQKQPVEPPKPPKAVAVVTESTPQNKQ